MKVIISNVTMQGMLKGVRPDPFSISIDTDDILLSTSPYVEKNAVASMRHCVDIVIKNGGNSTIRFATTDHAEAAWRLLSGEQPSEKLRFLGFNILVRRDHEYSPELVAIKDYIQMAYPCSVRLDMNLLPGVNILVMDGPTTVGSTIEQVMDYCQQLP